MLEIRFRKIKYIAIFDLSGSIDIDSANLIERVGWCLENGYRDFLCNFEGVEKVDYAGLSAIAIAYKNVINHKGRMKFLCVPVHIKKMFSLVCLDKVFELHEDESRAVESFDQDENFMEIQQKKLRRRFKRLPLDIAIEFKSIGEDKFHKGKLLNISGVGMLIFSEKIYPLGEKLDVKMSLLPQPGRLEVTAKVAWLVDKKIQHHIYPGMGLEFHHLDTKVQERIIEFVERNLPLDSSE